MLAMLAASARSLREYANDALDESKIIGLAYIGRRMFVHLVGKFIQECSNRRLTGRDRGRRRIRRKRDNNARYIANRASAAAALESYRHNGDA